MSFQRATSDGNESHLRLGIAEDRKCGSERKGYLGLEVVARSPKNCRMNSVFITVHAQRPSRREEHTNGEQCDGPVQNSWYSCPDSNRS